MGRRTKPRAAQITAFPFPFFCALFLCVFCDLAAGFKGSGRRSGVESTVWSEKAVSCPAKRPQDQTVTRRKGQGNTHNHQAERLEKWKPSNKNSHSTARTKNSNNNLKQDCSKKLSGLKGMGSQQPPSPHTRP